MAVRARLEALLSWVLRHPVSTSAALGGAGLLAYAVWRAATPAPLFRDEPASGVRFKADAEYAGPVRGLVRAIRELHAEGLFKEQEARVVTREFVDLARAGSSVDAAGEPVISRGACRSLFARIGIKSQRVADSLFDSFDEDGSGTISLKEFLHALVLVMRGGASEKLERVFDCIDLDHDGLVSESEMIEFFRTMHTFSGTPKPLAAVQAHVLAMFRATRCKTDGFLDRDEFRDLVSITKFRLGETLGEFYDQMTERFALGMEDAAAAATSG